MSQFKQVFFPWIIYHDLIQLKFGTKIFQVTMHNYRENTGGNVVWWGREDSRKYI